MKIKIPQISLLSGNKIPKLGLGTWGIGGGPTKDHNNDDKGQNVIIIPGFTSATDNISFKSLGEELSAKGFNVIKIAWPYLPEDLGKYNFTNTINYSSEVISKLENKGFVLLGFSMGGVIATKLATLFPTKKLGLIVSPYQAGSEDDLSGKYKEWKASGFRIANSTKYGELKVPFSFIEDARKYNALEMISKVDCPKLFIVAEKDTKVSNNASRKLYNAAKEPKEWCQIPKMEHKYQYQSQEMIDKVNAKIIKFINS
ncbi:hypothetical protein A2630_02695 [Candidatus Woesebacteria bacterium RIFCSPHIGHO2_01_FULL_44_10]|uniref:Serine hydrolase domain-containing protein n=1 Tax=Candidatus Woesebacteria bacterium RIFCSPLOWO2_01_FULL_44_14 TaxID=1802525 RepID=A0A1F8C3T0_9BACT|nr:MAG: hypothetical protein A2630_02695 [Candidatus Woesebacteria bacterium RIFCSPHIGHO2_01_FULL_44_10]OGM56148.1 MAG: hypothetical protein A3F62_00765 [Candidatus Woesebacteria bacterium RIFCSPHIGHO2_12_FULL_44_11]OGM70951.1 MAG: hypothetical protein A2975_01610 [Candidatus Woesebacteria bacterium RIFCSPLOWO2_01_FULL_44_14]